MKIESFWDKVIVTGESDCWVWTGAMAGQYGSLWLSSNEGGRGYRIYAHRLSWEIYNNKKVPQNMDVMHSCDNKICVNPAHLSIGTRSQNVRDAVARGLTNSYLAARNQCNQGHDYDLANTRWYRGYRLCRMCQKNYQTRYRDKHKQIERMT